MKDNPIQDIGTIKTLGEKPKEAPKWLSMSEAALLTPYSAEYLSLLARKKKIASKKIGNAWYTTKEVLDDYMQRQMVRSQLTNGNLPEIGATVQSTLEPKRTYGQDIRRYQLEQELLGGTAHVEQALERVLDKKIRETSAAEFPEENKIRQHFRVATSSKVLVAATLAAILIFSLLPVPFVFSFVSSSVEYMQEALNDANTVLGFRPGTHANELLLLDKEGNVSIMGHIETEGQLRSYAAQGIAPITVDSTTTAKNLSADFLDGASAEEFTLAYVTKNGNMTTEDVFLEGNVEAGKILLVKGAAKLLSTLEVGEKLEVFGDAEFRQALEVLGPAYFESLVTLAGDAKVKGNFDVSKNITVRGSVESKSSIVGKSGSFGSLGVSSSFSAGGKVTLGDPEEVVTIAAENITLDENGNMSLDGILSVLGIGVSALTVTNSTTTSATTTNFFATNASFTNLDVDAQTLDSLIFINATGTSATTTNLFSTTANIGTLSGDLSALDNSIDIGSAGVRFGKIYADEVNASTLVGTLTGGNLTAETLTINSDNATADTEDSNLVFERGTSIPNALLTWDSTNDRFAFNSDVFVGSGVGSGSLLVNSSTTLQNFTFVNATGTSATTTSFFSTTASSTNLFSTLLTVGGTGLVVDSSRNVGIGTVAPTERLVLADTTAANDAEKTMQRIEVGADGTLGAAVMQFGVKPSATGASRYGYINVGDNADWRNLVLNQSGGNVGIGTTSPAYKLSVEGSSTLGNQAIVGYFTATTTTDSVFPRFTFTAATGTSATTTSFFSTTASSTNLFSSLLTVGGTGLVVDASRNVGIGTTGPGSKLDVRGGLNAGTNGTEFTVSTAGVVVGGTYNSQTISSAASFTGSLAISTSLDVGASAQFGSGNVALIDSTGKITGLSSTYFNADTSANLASILSDETGTAGGFVRATGPTVTTLTVSTGGIAVTGDSTISGTLGSITTLTATTLSGDLSCTGCVGTTEIDTDGVGQAEIAAGAVHQGELSTGTNSSVITTTSDVSMNDYTFAPKLDRDDCTGNFDLPVHMSSGDVANDTVGYLRIIMSASCSNGSADVRWRYVNASDRPTIWAIANSDGSLVNVWEGEDPVGEDWPLNPNPFEGTKLQSGQRFVSVEPLTVSQVAQVYSELPDTDRDEIKKLLRDYVVDRRGWLAELNTIEDLANITERYEPSGRQWAMRFIAEHYGISPSELILETMTVGVGDKLIPKSNYGAAVSEYLAARQARLAENARQKAELLALPESQQNADIAEWYSSAGQLEAGDIVSVGLNGTVDKSVSAYDDKVLSVVSTAPSQVLGRQTSEGDVKLALTGRVPVKVSLENGPIMPGDRLTTSSTPGVAMKATKPGMTIGVALEGADQDGRVLTFLNLDYWTPSLAETENNIASSSQNISVSSDGWDLAFWLDDIWEATLARFSDFGISITQAFTRVNNLFATTLHIENQLCVDDICISKENLKALLIQAGGVSVSASSVFSGGEGTVTITPALETAPTATSTDSANLPLPEPAATSTPSAEPVITETVSEPVPAPASELTPEPTPEPVPAPAPVAASE